LKGVKMTTPKWTINTAEQSRAEQQDLHYPAARFNNKGVFVGNGVEMLLGDGVLYCNSY